MTTFGGGVGEFPGIKDSRKLYMSVASLKSNKLIGGFDIVARVTFPVASSVIVPYPDRGASSPVGASFVSVFEKAKAMARTALVAKVLSNFIV
jgi:hypothetical protein